MYYLILFSENLKDMGTISREGLHYMLYYVHVRTLRDYTFGGIKQILMNLEPQWIVGFVDGEGCFFVGINDNFTLTQKKQVLPEFVVVQHERNVATLHALKNYFKCGVVRVNHGDRMCYRVRGHANLMQVILPFFEKHKLKTKKRIDFEKFRDIVRLMDNKEHLTAEGIEKINKIRNQMNTKGLKLSIIEPKIESSFD
jgi:hypothetical protein